MLGHVLLHHLHLGSVIIHHKWRHLRHPGYLDTYNNTTNIILALCARRVKIIFLECKTYLAKDLVYSDQVANSLGRRGCDGITD